MAVRCFLNGQQLSGPSSPVLGVNSSSSYSLCGWVYVPTTWPTSTISMFGVYMTATTTTAIQFGTRAALPGDIVLWTWGGGTVVSTNGLFTFSANTWYHLGYTFNGTTHSVYVNGVLINTSVTVPLAGTLDIPYINGYIGGGASESGNFLVDDILFLSRSISGNEMMTIYKAFGLQHGIVLNSIAMYEMQEGSVNSNVLLIKDVSNSGASLSPIGTGTTPIYVEGYAGNNSRFING